MFYKPKHQKNEEQAAGEDEQETVSGPAEEIMDMLGRIGKQGVVNMILLEMIMDLAVAVAPLLEAERDRSDGAGGVKDPLATAMAFGAPDQE